MKSIVLACLGILLLLPLMVVGQDCGLLVKGIIQQPSCQGGMDGNIRLQVSGGKGPYTYHWHTGQDMASISQLTAGTYKVRVQNTEGCEATATFTLKGQEKDLGIQVKQRKATGGIVLEVHFTGNIKPAAIYIKNLTQGIHAPQKVYNGQVLKSGTYLLEAFTAAGCSVLERLKIEEN